MEVTNIPQKISGLYTQTPAPQPFLDSKVNICNGKIFSEKVWTLAFLDPPPPFNFWTPKKAQKRFNTSLPASIYNIEPRLLMNHQSLCLAVFLKPGKAIFSLITQHNNTNQIQPSLHPAETDNTEII